ncbi:MAG: RNA polymerase sigma factor [Planctomycetota bacterium]|jgi:RNA polymerase sigma-70 factor (ECF subfamily)
MDEHLTGTEAADGSNAGDSPPPAQRLEELREGAVRFAFRMTGDLHNAEEAVQDAFVRLLQALDQFRGESSFRTYVFAAVRNSCLDQRRRRLTKSGRLREINPSATNFFHSLPQGSRFLGVTTQVRRRESQEIVRAAINRLPERQRDCMILHDLEGFLYREVAEILGITANHVGVLLYQARIGLRKLIEEGGFFDAD